ncbi:MAG: multicopper oxidase family protein [Actinomycetota bacterium]|nr:multicopper oxidase family protein [Actinomycetota bacterium]
MQIQERPGAPAEADGKAFPTDVVGLPKASAPDLVDVGAGETFDLRIHPVVKTIGGSTVRMLSYNGSIPGPTLRVQQKSEILVDVTNDGDIESTVHWHGLRLENGYDGVPHDTQDPIPVGGRYTHRLQFPDAGVFWYHPHLREDYAQEMGLYGNVLVVPSDPNYWSSADREIVLTLDDILIENGRIASFDPHGPTYTAMGRFGNVLLVGGQTSQAIEVRRGEVVRFYLTNTANTRVFRVSIPDVRMKLVGSDGGRYENERWVNDVVIAPSERVVVHALFDRPGGFRLEHRTAGRTYPLMSVNVLSEEVEFSSVRDFESLRTNPEMVGERERVAPYLAATPEKTLALIAEMDFEEPGDGSSTYTCPMHPEVVTDTPGKCPKCGMKLMPVEPAPTSYTCPMHPEVVTDAPGKCPKCGMKLLQTTVAGVEEEGGSDADKVGHHSHGDSDEMADGIEWEDMMPEVNRMTTPNNMRWKLVDRATGKENADIDWVFPAGDQVKIRLVNEMESDHPMHHPFHVHGQRFLVLARDGVVESNLVWKDTVLVRTGERIDILMDASNPGLWMAHCHIAEHAESGMMFSFRVAPRNEST